MKKKLYVSLIAIVGVILLGVFIYQDHSSKVITVSYNEFIDQVEEGSVDKVILTDGANINYYMKNGEITYRTANPRNLDFKTFLLENNVTVEESQASSIVEIVQGFFFIALMIGVFLYFQKRGKKQENNSKLTKDFNSDLSSNIKFNNIAGNVEAKESVQDIINFIKKPETFLKYGARMPKGIIFYGSPGTGKTLMAKAIAGEADVPFFSVSGSDFVQMYVGVGASRVRKLFETARKHKKAVIFIDEIDALGKKRGNEVSNNDERDQTLNALLTEMSGFESSEGIVVIAATNRLDILDDALLRPGRFDRQIEIGLPDVNARHEILKLHCRNKPISDEIDLGSVAKQTVYFSGAMLENLLNEAAIFAALDQHDFITMKHIDKAYYTIVAGAEKKDKSVIKQKDREITAFHEAGHALITKIVAPENTVAKVTIIPSTKGAGGFSMNIAPDQFFYSKKQMESNIMISLAGRAAEEIIFGKEEITTGASNDIEKATRLIKDLTSKYGMSENLGLLNYDIVKNSKSIDDEKMINELKVKMNHLYAETKQKLIKNKYYLNRIATELLDKETLNEEQLEAIMGNNEEENTTELQKSLYRSNDRKLVKEKLLGNAY